MIKSKYNRLSYTMLIVNIDKKNDKQYIFTQLLVSIHGIITAISSIIVQQFLYVPQITVRRS